jgi:hypothetical protein
MVNDSEVICVRFSSEIVKQLRESGEVEKVSTKIQKIVKNFLDSQYLVEQHWMSIPRELAKILYDDLTVEALKLYSDSLYETIEKLQVTDFPNLSLWQTWILIEKQWADRLQNIITHSDMGGYEKFLHEHNLSKSVSQIIYNLYEKCKPEGTTIKIISLDENKLILEIH